MQNGMVLPMSTMPGEQVGHVYAGPMAAETIHFIEAVAGDRPVLVTAEHARMVMEVYIAADLSAETNEVVTLPLKRTQPLALAAGGARREAARPGTSALRSSAPAGWACFAAKTRHVIRMSTGSASPRKSPCARRSSQAG